MEGLTPIKTDLGDVCPRKVYYFTQSGQVLMKRIERLKNKTIVARESDYASKIQAIARPVEEDVTLF
jgi:chemotaxis protein CheD